MAFSWALFSDWARLSASVDMYAILGTAAAVSNPTIARCDIPWDPRTRFGQLPSRCHGSRESGGIALVATGPGNQPVP